MWYSLSVLTVHVLGAVEAHRDGRPVDLGGPLQRAVLAHLALDAGTVVSVDRLIDRLWGDHPPRTPLGTLQSYVSRLRRLLEPSHEAGAAPQVLVSTAPGYVLHLPHDQIDVHRFRSLVADGREAAAADDPSIALARFDEALALWTGPALGGIGPEDQIAAIVVRLDEERAAAREDRFDALLALGRHAETVPRLQAAVVEHPLRERLWAQLALALYRSGRQADAMRAIGTARDRLLDDLGLDLSPDLRDLEQRILVQDPSLSTPARHMHDDRPVLIDAPTTDTELVGRDAERAVLAAALAGATTRPHLVLLEGEPGIGKSTLSEAVVTTAATNGWTVAVGRCVEVGLAPSLWPMIELTRALLGDDAPADGTALNPWRRLAGGREIGPCSQVEMAAHFVDVLDDAGGGPFLLVVDDLHWADQATLDVLRLVLDRLGRRPVLVLAAHRPVDLVPDTALAPMLGALHRTNVEVVRVQLSPLDEAGVARLVEITTGVVPSADVAARVRARASGNPLFVSELARLAGERGLTDESVVPDAIVDVVRDRLARLPERATAELEVAAVLGEHFDLRTAMAASERAPDDCLDALDAAIVTRILVPTPNGFRFAHALVRDAVLAQLPPLRRARLHHRAADAIVSVRGDLTDDAEPIAHHRLESAAFADPLVVAAAQVRASDVARWRGALDTAEQYAEHALAVLADVPRSSAMSDIEVDALEALVSAAMQRPDAAGIEGVTARIARFAESTGSDAALALWQFLDFGDIDRVDDLRALQPELARIRELAERTEQPYAVVTTNFMLGAMAFLSGDFDEADRRLGSAVEATGVSSPDEPPQHIPLVLLPMIAAFNAAVLDRHEEAMAHAYRRSAAWLSRRREVDSTADVTLAFTQALVHAQFDEPAAALAQLATRPRSPMGGLVAHQPAACDLLEAWARVRLGETDQLAVAFAASDELSASDERTLVGALWTFLGDACRHARDDRAASVLQRAHDESSGRGETWWLAETLRQQALVAEQAGDRQRAARLLGESRALATRQGATVILRRLDTSSPDTTT
ncbi:MAG: AAA family ATPase [Actinobacteria bacterium]|nr:AAA family ATPase [Actinomycetota bacterium]